ncbi:MAG TPA: hypothetical protein VF167_02435 [Longimicrobiaceae bacterium]
MMLAKALAELPGVRSLHEPEPHLVTEGYLRWAGRMSSEEAAQQLRLKRSSLIDEARKAGEIYVESSHYCSHLIPELARVFDAKFVFLHRDARGFTRSGLARPHWYPDFDAVERLKTFVRRRFGVQVGNFWHDHRLEPPAELDTRMKKIAWLWTEINRVILRDLATVEDDRKFEIRLDEVGPERLAELARFIGCDFGEADLNRMVEVAERKPNRRTSAPPEDDEWDESAFLAITAETSRALGYDEERV